MMNSIAAAALSAFFGAFAAFIASLLLTRVSKRRELTDQLVNDFFSDAFMLHRVSLSKTRQAVNANPAILDKIAPGFWFQGGLNDSDIYRGEITAALDEHQHLEIYLGFIIRLQYAVDRRRVDTRRVRSLLSDALRWDIGLLKRLAATTEEQVANNNGQQPTWVRAVGVVGEKIVQP